MQSGHTDIGDPGGSRAVDPGRKFRFGGHSPVGSAGGHDSHTPDWGRDLTDDDRPSLLMDNDGEVREFPGDSPGVADPGGQCRSVRMGGVQVAQNVGHLGGVLAGTVDDLGISRSCQPIDVDAGEPEVGVTRLGTGAR